MKQGKGIEPSGAGAGLRPITYWLGETPTWRISHVPSIHLHVH